MYRTLLCKVWVRCLFSLQGQGSNVKVPHLARKVWVRSSYSLVMCLERDLCLSYTLHTLTFSMRTNSVLTPCKQGAVLSRYSDSLRTFTLLHFFFQWEQTLYSHQARCGTFLTNETKDWIHLDFVIEPLLYIWYRGLLDRRGESQPCLKPDFEVCFWGNIRRNRTKRPIVRKVFTTFAGQMALREYPWAFGIQPVTLLQLYSIAQWVNNWRKSNS